MNYFNYVPSCTAHLGKVWNLFDSMSMEEINLNSYEYSLEIVKSALQGNISLSEDSDGETLFSLKDYTYGCKRNEKISRRANVKKELFIVDSFTEDENEKIGFGDISERVLKDIDTMIDTMLDDESFEQSIISLLGIRNEYLVKEGVDVVELIKGSLNNVKESIKILSRLIKKDNRLATIVEGLIGTGHGDEVLSRLAVIGG